MPQKNILIIDDDTRNIFALTATLRSEGFNCISCTGAQDALDILKGNEPVDIVLIDMMMPDIDGYEAIPMIRAIQKRAAMPIVAVTAQAMMGDREKCLEAGANEYISKPINVDKLIQLIGSY